MAAPSQLIPTVNNWIELQQDSRRNSIESIFYMATPDLTSQSQHVKNYPSSDGFRFHIHLIRLTWHRQITISFGLLLFIWAKKIRRPERSPNGSCQLLGPKVSRLLRRRDSFSARVLVTSHRQSWSIQCWKVVELLKLKNATTFWPTQYIQTKATLQVISSISKRASSGIHPTALPDHHQKKTKTDFRSNSMLLITYCMPNITRRPKQAMT